MYHCTYENSIHTLATYTTFNLPSARRNLLSGQGAQDDFHAMLSKTISEPLFVVSIAQGFVERVLQ